MLKNRDSLTREIARAYAQAEPWQTPYTPQHSVFTHLPRVHIYRTYQALHRALRPQLETLRAFVDITVTDTDPYRDSATMFEDIRANRHLAVFAGGTLPAGHPMADTALLLSDRSISWNIVFRAVHDGLAHYPGKRSFSPVGEWRAFQAHAALIGHSNREALHALFTETLAQNCVYQLTGMFAEQKAVLLPYELVQRALALEV